MDRKQMIMIAGGLVGVLLLGLVALGGGCFRTKEATTVQQVDRVELTYYKLFDDSDVIEPLLQQYSADRPNVKINYRQFTDEEEYYDLILNELAEGEGPDIFSVPNTWYLRNSKKINPAPLDMYPPQIFEETFASVTYDDLVRVDPETGSQMVYGMPMTVDTLALFYNKDHFDDAIPERGKPSITWDGIKEDVFKLTKQNKSFERFEVAGMAMGFADNISRAVDILYLLMLQEDGNFYDETGKEAIFAKQQGTASDGSIQNPGVNALDFFTSFANPSNKNYSWNAYLSAANSPEKEITTFARGKVSMIIGYSYMYDQIVTEINELKSRGLDTMEISAIKVAPIPQITDPSVSTTKRDAFAHYFTETVSRTSENPRWAWDLLIYLTSQESLQHYFDKTHKPTSRRDMIEEQQNDPIYGVFAEQIGIAESIPVWDEDYYEETFIKAINNVLSTKSPSDAMKIAQEEINAILPSDGLFPIITTSQEDATNSANN